MRKPDYNLSFLNKVTEEKGRIGAAWVNVDGSVSIVLNPMVTIRQDQNVIFNLFPNTPYVKPTKGMKV